MFSISSTASDDILRCMYWTFLSSSVSREFEEAEVCFVYFVYSIYFDYML